MTALSDKLNLRGQSQAVVLNAPAEFEAELAQWDGVEILRAAGDAKSIAFGLAFAVTKAERDAASVVLIAKADADAILWIAYPKSTSKRYVCEFNRDSGWDIMQAAGFDTVRMVAIDEDWSALRFRRDALIRRVTAQPAPESGRRSSARAARR